MQQVGKEPLIYADFDSLCEAVAKVSLGSAQVETLSKLLKVYFKALHNPPEGVIGVGAITYAERKLVEYQLNERRTKITLWSGQSV